MKNHKTWILPSVLLGVSCMAASRGVEAVETAAPAAAAETAPASVMGFYSLDSFGPVGIPKQAGETYKKAMEYIGSKGGGTLIVPSTVAKDWRFANNEQGTIRTPAPPAPTAAWGTYTPGVTVIDTRGGTVKIHPPQVTGMELNRTFVSPEGQGANHWEYYPMLSLQNNVVRGSTSYLDYLQENTPKGKDARFYVPTIRGIFPGMFITAHSKGGYGGEVQRLYVKGLGYDNEKKMSYFIADTNIDHNKGSIVHNKTHVNALKVDTNAHTELQTFDITSDRHHYSQGDSYTFNNTFHYMGNVHSAAGDENGVLYAAFIYGDTNNFVGKVTSVNPEKNEVVFTGARTHTLGTGRPLINLNPAKHITGGSVYIVRPASYWQLASEDPTLTDPVFKGKTYPTTSVKNPKTGVQGLSMGGLIQSSADAPWTPDVVGRYFAVTVADEKIPAGLASGVGGNLRWYLITSFKQNPDGTKEIKIERHWWGSKEAGSPTLYQDGNYSSDGNLKPLTYTIAPGSNVYDVARAVTDPTGQPYEGGASARTLLVAPYSDKGTTFDFAIGDSIEQAIGPDPFHPIPFRSWIWDRVPGAFPSPVFDIVNNGVTRSSIMNIAGTNIVNKDMPPWDNVLNVTSDVGYVLNLAGKVQKSAIRIAQPGKPAPITWMYENGTKAANLTVDQKGLMTFDGKGAYITGGLTTAGGISGTEVEARNLRGIDVPVTKGATSLEVKFTRPETDGNYALFLETNWINQRSITAKTAQGFTVTFAAGAPDNAKLDWTLIR